MQLYNLEFEIQLNKPSGSVYMEQTAEELISCLHQFCDKYGFVITKLTYTGDRH